MMRDGVKVEVFKNEKGELCFKNPLGKIIALTK